MTFNYSSIRSLFRLLQKKHTLQYHRSFLEVPKTTQSIYFFWYNTEDEVLFTTWGKTDSEYQSVWNTVKHMHSISILKSKDINELFNHVNNSNIVAVKYIVS